MRRAMRTTFHPAFLLLLLIPLTNSQLQFIVIASMESDRQSNPFVFLPFPSPYIFPTDFYLSPFDVNRNIYYVKVFVSLHFDSRIIIQFVSIYRD